MKMLKAIRMFVGATAMVLSSFVALSSHVAQAGQCADLGGTCLTPAKCNSIEASFPDEVSGPATDDCPADKNRICCVFAKGAVCSDPDAVAGAQGYCSLVCIEGTSAVPKGTCPAEHHCCAPNVAQTIEQTKAKAAPPTSGSPTTLVDPLKGIGIIGALNRIILTFLGMVGALALLVFVYAGVVYLTAGGEAKRVEHAVNTMKYAFIGLVLIMGAYVLTSFYFNALIAS